jgi:hypothetical protein
MKRLLRVSFFCFSTCLCFQSLVGGFKQSIPLKKSQ